MSEASPVTVPRGALIAALALILCVIGVAAFTRLTGIGMARLADAPTLLSRDLRFEDRPDGGITVVDATTRATIDILTPGRDGFVRVALRSLVRTRKIRDFGAEAPFRLSLRADHRYLLDDLATGQRLDLVAFGAVNAQAFARLLTLADGTS